MKNSKTFALSFLVVSLFLFSMVMVSAVPALVSPLTNGTLTGASAVLNVTNGTLTEMLNCTWYASSASTANSTAVSIGAQTNESASATNINMTFDSTILEDSNDYVIYAQCFNATSNETTVSSTGVIIDNTNPTAPTLTPADETTKTTAGTQTFTGTVIDATTTACTYTIYRGGSPSDGDAGSASYSGTTCTASKTFSTTADNGIWWVTMTASDGEDTASTTNKFNVNLPGLGGGNLPLTDDGADDGISGDGTQSMAWIFVLIVIVAIISLVFFFKKNK